MFKLKGFFAYSSNWVKFVVALLIPFFFLCLTSAFMAVVLKLAGEPESLSVGAELAVQFVSSIITFIVGGGLAAYLIFEEPKEELKLSSFGKGKNYLYGIIALLALLPIVGVVNEWNQAISLPDFLAPLEAWMREIGVSMNITELGATEAMIPQLVEATFRLDGGYKQLTREEVAEIFRQSL